MRRRLVIHIGMHKTGSSSIQRFLSRNRWLLKRLGVFYPATRRADGRREPKHNRLFEAISHEADHGAAHPAFGEARDVVAEITDQIERAAAPLSILSAEGLSGERPVFAEALAPLAARFECRIVVFLRRPDDWVESFYKQMVVSREVRETRSLGDFINAQSTQDHLDFDRILSWWAEAFGDDALRVAAFPPANGARLIDEFLRAADAPRWLGRLPYANARENRSPNWGEVARVRSENRKEAGLAAEDVRLDEGLSAEQRFEVFQSTHDSMARLRKRLQSSQNGSPFIFLPE